MKTLLSISLIFLLAACNYSGSLPNQRTLADTIVIAQKIIPPYKTIKTIKPATKLSVIVLPPYDMIANAGISPDIQSYLEEDISKDTSLALIKFPYKKLMNVPYYNIFDKKYCEAITDKINADVIIMSRLDQTTRTGKMAMDKWGFQIKIYNTKADKQLHSTLKGNDLTDNDIKTVLSKKRSVLTEEIKTSAH